MAERQAYAVRQVRVGSEGGREGGGGYMRKARAIGASRREEEARSSGESRW